MTATPDRPATTPEGEQISTRGVLHAMYFTDDDILRAAAEVNAARLSERTEGAGEVALSKEEREDLAHAVVRSFVDRPMVERHGLGVLDRSRCDRYVAPAVERILARRALPTAGRETAIRAVHDLEATSADPSVEEYVDAVLAALPTAGRVVEAERVEEFIRRRSDIPTKYRLEMRRALLDGSAES